MLSRSCEHGVRNRVSESEVDCRKQVNGYGYNPAAIVLSEGIEEGELREQDTEREVQANHAGENRSPGVAARRAGRQSVRRGGQGRRSSEKQRVEEAKVRIAYVNVNGKLKKEIGRIQGYAMAINWQVVCIVETHLTPKRKLPELVGYYY